MRADDEYTQAVEQAKLNLRDSYERGADAVGGDALEFMDTLLTPEEKAESDLRVALIGDEGMMMKNDFIWSISLIIIGIASVVLFGSNIIGLKLPDAIVRVIGIIDLIALPFAAFTTVKKLKRGV